MSPRVLCAEKLLESGLCDFAAAQAGGAHAHALVAALNFRVHRAQIHVPAPLAHVVGVADVISKLRPLAADIAYLCHIKKLQILLTRKS
jgi:hypothetical protein